MIAKLSSDHLIPAGNSLKLNFRISPSKLLLCNVVDVQVRRSLLKFGGDGKRGEFDSLDMETGRSKLERGLEIDSWC